MDLRDGNALWRGLETGTWSVIERGGRVVARENALRGPPLTAREREVIEHACRGHSNKRIAHDLDIATSSVSTHLSRASRKLGLDRTAIIRIRSALARTAVPPTVVAEAATRLAVVAWPVEGSLAALSPAEREVARLAVLGASNAHIARVRRVSVKTVANQVASVLHKLGVGSRAELAAHLAGATGDR